MKFLLGLFVACVALLFFLAFVAFGTQQGRVDSFYRHCAEQGGHIYKPDTASWCLSSDERWIEVYP